MNKILRPGLTGLLLMILAACGNGGEELTLEEAEAMKRTSQDTLLSKTVSRPGGREPYSIGKPGGTWRSSVTSDPKTFNMIVANTDASATGILGGLVPGYLADYDPYTREWEPETASFEIVVFEEEDRLDVVFTLRDDLWWTYQHRDEKVKITSDDVVFWYDEIEGNPELQMSAYNGQFLTMPDGSSARVTIEKLDDRRFVFHFPRIVANPVLSCNMYFGPRFLYEPALREGGARGVKEIFTIDTDVRELPSAGEYYLTEYTPGVRLVYVKNPHYWDTDAAGNILPYIEQSISKIVPDMNTTYLLFKNGDRDGYNVRPEDLEELVNKENRDYTVYNGGAVMGSNFVGFNQNPSGLPDYMHEWFTQKEFRQAMSRLSNRERMIKQIYRGLGTPAEHFYAVANPFFDEDIRLKYTYDPEEAVKLLASIGMERDGEGIMRDREGRAVEFDIITNTDNNLRIDSASIFADECGKVGIKVNVKPLDFQKMVDMLTQTYDWHAILISLGTNYWPTGGSNVWPSSGNLHFWNPLQTEPASAWEARVDYLYNEGSFTPDPEKARPLWDEFQTILLEELPVIYLVHSNSFYAIRDKWDNMYYDTLGGLKSNYLYLKDTE